MKAVNDVISSLDWREQVVYSPEGPRPVVLTQNEKAKVVLAGLEPGQVIPPRPEVYGVFHCLEGQGWMEVDGERLPFNAGATVIVPEGGARGVEAETRLAFLAVRIG